MQRASNPQERTITIGSELRADVTEVLSVYGALIRELRFRCGMKYDGQEALTSQMPVVFQNCRHIVKV